MIRRFLAAAVLIAMLWDPVQVLNAGQAPVTQNADLNSANQLYRSGRFAEAAEGFQAIVKRDPMASLAQLGLIHSLLRAQEPDRAQAAALAALTAQPNSSQLVTALGDVQFRLGDMAQAERSYLKAESLDSRNPGPYVGAAHVYRAYSLYRRAYDQLDHAHQLAPNNPEVQLLWLSLLSPRERIKAIETYLASASPADPEETALLRRYLEFLNATVNKPAHACHLVSKVEQTNTKLLAMKSNTSHLASTGLEVKLNGHATRLALDTGSSGILVRSDSAAKAGLTRIAEQRIGGLGDTGRQSGYVALANRVRIGDLEFEDCAVRVFEATGPSENDGLIGTDVFGAYLINIDIPAEKLRLSPLPKRPDEAAAPTALNSAGETQDIPEDTVENGGEQRTAAPPNQGQGANAVPSITLPKDAYVAPEMARWTKVFRFGHILLIPTLVDKSESMLFMIDTGAFTNILSTRAAREVTQVRSDPHTQVKGLSGTVSNVYRADKATLEFGHYSQENQDIVTLDLSAVSKSTGTEVSGILGFEMLRILQVKIDYRDGLVDFLYDPKHLPKGLSIK
ncbi:MAG: aspartyl protease family protein [Candidatus Korobacteraceae bacterium]